jgi:hypothetical protein
MERFVHQEREGEVATRTRIQVGTTLEPRELVSIRGQRVPVPDRGQFIHLQFRRFAGCPVCDLHLHSIVRRQEELIAASIREVVVFHSTREELLGFASGLPFDVVADPANICTPASASSPARVRCWTRAPGRR